MTLTKKRLLSIYYHYFGFTLREYKIQTPIGHELPFILMNHPRYMMNIAEEAKRCNGQIIDAGASIGDTVAILRSVSNSPILAIEPDELAFKYLRMNCVANNLSVRCINDTINADNTLDELSLRWGLNNIGFIKIDTEGSDLQVLMGCKRILREHPKIMFEYNPNFYKDGEWKLFFSYLYSHGYKYFKFYTNVGDYLLLLEYPKHKKQIYELSEYCLKTPYFYFDIAAE